MVQPIADEFFHKSRFRLFIKQVLVYRSFFMGGKMKSLIALIFLLTLSTLTVASETYSGVFFLSKGNTRKTTNNLTYQLDMTNKSSITGALNVSGNNIGCSGDYKISRGSIKVEDIVLFAEPSDANCGPYIFKGKVVADELVGNFGWGGQPREVTLRR